MINRVILVGRLTADPERKQTNSGVPCCHIRLAVDRKTKKEDGTRDTDFINCTGWRQTADFICKYFSKGSMIIVEGQLRNNDYTDNNDVKHYSMDVLIDSASFASPKSDGAAQQQQQQPYGQPQQPYGQYAPPYGAAQQQAPPPQSYQAPPPQPYGQPQYQQPYAPPPQPYGQQPY